MRVRAPAKINLTLHVTGQRRDGYHLLDSLVMFARDACDAVTLDAAPRLSLRVEGPRAAGVPEDGRNLCWQAAEAFGAPASITLHKSLPHAAGIGGGSSDAAAVLRGLAELHDRAFTGDALALGADVPVCMVARAARMQGIGEQVTPLDLPPLFAVLVNPGVDVPTPRVFRALTRRDNPAMAPIPPQGGAAFLDWLRAQRNDLQGPAMDQAPQIGDALDALGDATLARMSGSGATCFGLYPSETAARTAAARIAAAHEQWWVCPSALI